MKEDQSAIITERLPREADPGFLGTCSVLLVALVCSIVVIASPRPVQPSRLPALRVPLSEGQRAFADVRRSGEPLPKAAWFERWYELYSEAGLNEREPQVDMSMVAQQRAELAAITREEFPKLGGQRVRALLNTLSTRALDALPLDRPPNAAYGLLGGLPALLSRYGYIDAQRRPIAPMRVLQVVYQQRLNLLCERPIDGDIDRFDLMLAEGWIALHAPGIPPERRALAAKKFVELGGLDAREAWAVWLYHGDLAEQASALLEREYERTRALRLRNMLLFLSRGG